MGEGKINKAIGEGLTKRTIEFCLNNNINFIPNPEGKIAPYSKEKATEAAKKARKRIDNW